MLKISLEIDAFKTGPTKTAYRRPSVRLHNLELFMYLLAGERYDVIATR